MRQESTAAFISIVLLIVEEVNSFLIVAAKNYGGKMQNCSLSCWSDDQQQVKKAASGYKSPAPLEPMVSRNLSRLRRETNHNNPIFFIFFIALEHYYKRGEEEQELFNHYQLLLDIVSNNCFYFWNER